MRSRRSWRSERAWIAMRTVGTRWGRHLVSSSFRCVRLLSPERQLQVAANTLTIDPRREIVAAGGKMFSYRARHEVGFLQRIRQIGKT